MNTKHNSAAQSQEQNKTKARRTKINHRIKKASTPMAK